ncbi:MAG: ParB/RepB/Spo0J family partition protein [Cyclobacteriaceae bacterium]
MTQSNQPKKRSALGRGLGALLEDSNTGRHKEELATDIAQVNIISEVSLDQVEVNPFQPRTDFDQDALQELSESIKIQGIIQPITVRRLSQNQYQLISGERRLQASKLAGLTKIPAYIRTADDQQMLEMALIENIQRENLNAIEIALSYQRLISECSLKQEELGDRVGKKRATVNNYLRLLRLPPDVQAGIRDGKITMGHARALITLEDVDKQLNIFHSIIKDDLSVRSVEELVRKLQQGNTKQKAEKAESEEEADIKEVQTRLRSHFGTRVSIKHDKNNKGEIKIPYVSHDDLNRILDLINL